MVTLIKKLEMDGYDENYIPALVTIKFTSGDEVEYFRKGVGSANVSFSRNSLLDFEQPQYDFSEEKCDKYDFAALSAKYDSQLQFVETEYRLALEKAEKLFTQQKLKIKEYYKQRQLRHDELYSKITKQMFENHRNVKKSIDDERARLNTPAVRLEMIIEWLQEAKMGSAMKAAQILRAESAYILKKLKRRERVSDIFLSHVQKHSADLCRNLKDCLEKQNISVWYDLTAGRLDAHGMIDGVTEARLFLIVLTKEYFTRPWCIFEYCLALAGDKKIVTVAESDTRHGGGPLECFEIGMPFGVIMKHEIMQLNREYWNAFISKLGKRLRNTLGSGNMVETALFKGSAILKKQSDISFLVGEVKRSGYAIGECLYSSSEDGKNSAAFRKRCVGKGPTLTLLKDGKNRVFGGFTHKSWKIDIVEGGLTEVKGTWLFALNEGKESLRKDLSWALVGVPISGRPTFYFWDRSGMNRLEIYYDRKRGLRVCVQGFFGNDLENLKVIELEVFAVNDLKQRK